MRLITFRTTDKTDVDGLNACIQTQPNWAHLNDNTYIIGGSLSAKELVRILSVFKPLDLIVIPFHYYSWVSWDLTKDFVGYLNKHLSYDD